MRGRRQYGFVFISMVHQKKPEKYYFFPVSRDMPIKRVKLITDRLNA